MAFDRFRKGSAVFSCECCGRQTRDTQGSNVQLCLECYEVAGIENYISDNELTPDQLAEELARIEGWKAEARAKGGCFNEMTGT